MIAIHRKLVLAGLAACLIGGPVSAGIYSQNFDSVSIGGEWPTAPTGFPPGDHSSTNGWALKQGAIFDTYRYGSSGYSGWLGPYTAPETQILKTPLLAQGAGQISYVMRRASAGTSIYRLQKSATGTAPWVTLGTRTNSSIAWTSFDIDFDDIYGSTYLRFILDSGSGYLGLDEITITKPSAKVVFTDTGTDPATVYVDSPAHIVSTVTPYGDVSGLAVTSHWRTASGSWNHVPMTNSGANVWRSTAPVPGQPFGTRVFFYVDAGFSGTNPQLPASDPVGGASSPYYFDTAQRAYESGLDSLNVIDNLTAAMSLIADYTWQGVAESAGPVTNASFRFQGQDTNAVTRTWGDSTQPAGVMPLRDTAAEDQGAVTIPGTHSGQFVFSFTETNLAYEVRKGVYHDFSGWTIDPYGSGTDGGWVATNASIKTDSARQYVGNACYLDTNGTAYVRSPYLEAGIGHISFWYRNWMTNVTVTPTELYVQKSKTGGSAPSEWVTIATQSNILAQEYGRFHMAINDRAYPFVRILNSTNPASRARLCLDDVLISQAGAGVTFTNATTDPPNPLVIDTVDVSVDILSQANAANRDATLYYRFGQSGTFTPIVLTRSGDTFTTTSPIPNVTGDSTNVQYYIECAFTGYESELASPILYPDGGSNAPASYAVSPAVSFSGVSLAPSNPTIVNTVTVSINIGAQPGVTGLSAWLWYRAGSSGYFDAVQMTHTGGTTYQGVIPRGQAGTMQFFVEANYSGTSITNYISSYSPAAGGSGPYTYTNANATRTQNFNSVNVGNEWPTAPTGFTPGDHFSTNGWDLIKGAIFDTFRYGTSGYSGWLGPFAQYPDTALVSPLLEGGIGSVSFVRRCSGSGQINYGLDLISSDETTTTGIVEAAYNSTTWESVRYFVDALDASYIRIRKISDASANLYLGMDEISISYPAARIAIESVSYAPAYPSRDVPTTISCTIATATEYFPAMSISARLRHRKKGSTTWSSPITMTRSGTSTFSAQIPAVYLDDDAVEYYIEATFGGQYGSAAENRSPTYYPAGPVVKTTQYYGVPTSGFPSFTNRYFNSPYERLRIIGNFESVDMAQIDDDVWEGVFTTDATNLLDISLSGLNRLDDSLDTPTDSFWGDTNQWRYSLPVSGNVDEGGGGILLDGSFEGQYVVHVDLNTGEYVVQRADYQDFDRWYLNEEAFDNGSRDRISSGAFQDFDTWTNQTDRIYSTSFEDAWTNYASGWTSPQTVNLWFAGYFRSVDAGGERHRLELKDTANEGFVRQAYPQIQNDDGVGVATLTYRAVDSSTYPTIYSGPLSAGNVKVTTSVDGRDTHDDKDAYFGIFYRYMNSSNYYEARLVQDGNNQLIPYIYKTVNGVTSLGTTGSAVANKTLDDLKPGTFAVQVDSVNKHNVWVGTANPIKNWTNANVPGPGTVGLNARDASVRVQSVTVATNSITAFQEFFTNATATGWATGGNGWVINETADTYERVGRFGGGLQLQVGTTPKDFPNDYSSLAVAANITNVTSLAYVTTNVIIHVAEERYMAIFHREGNGSFRLDDVSVTGWRSFTNSYGTTVADSWIGGDTRVTTDQSDSSPHSLEMRASRAINIAGKSQFLRSPELDAIGTVAMRYFIPTGGSNVTIVTEYSDDLDRTDFQPLATNVLTAKGSWNTWSLPVNKDESPRKLHLRIRHASPAGDARFYIDDLDIASYYEGDTNAWITYNGLLTQDTGALNGGANLIYSGGSGRSGFLNYSTTADIAGAVPLDESNPHVRSPYLALGVGEISMLVRRWPVSGSPGQTAPLAIEISPTAAPGSWQTILSTNIVNTRWERLVLPCFDKSNHFVRVSNVITPTAPDRLGLDRLTVKAPLATDLVVANVTIVPEVPLYTDTVKVRAQLTDYILSPTVTQVRAYYHIGATPWGTWTDNQYLTLQLDEEASSPGGNPPVYVYESIDSIPTQAIDETVQYRVKVEYTGALLAEKTSPKIHTDPGINPSWYEPVNYNESLGGPNAQNPYYVVFSCDTGAVWINEINIDDIDGGDREFVELCGPVGTSIANWKIRLATTANATYGTYLITTNTTFSGGTNGLAFWVLGDDHVDVPADQVFTNAAVGLGYNMPFPQGGVQLYRSMGGLVQAVSYATYGDTTAAQSMQSLYGYQYIGQDLFTLDDYGQGIYCSLSLTNRAIHYGGFNWANDVGQSPGTINLYQEFGEDGTPGNFVLSIGDLELGPDIVLWTTYTNGVTPYVSYSTNLLQGDGWADVTNENWEVTNGLFRIWFPAMTSSPAYFYRVTVTN